MTPLDFAEQAEALAARLVADGSDDAILLASRLRKLAVGLRAPSAPADRARQIEELFVACRSGYEMLTGAS